MTLTQQDLQNVAHVLRQFGAREVYVFGSAALGRQTEHSDLDIAVSGIRPEIFFKAAAAATEAANWPVDLVDLDVDHPIINFLKQSGELRVVP